MALPSNYNPKDFESKIYEEWMKAGVGNPEVQMQEQVSNSKKTHTILMPPPNLTGDLHAGHAFGHYLQDTLTRIYRQKNQKSLWFPGVDHAGIQLEGVVDKLIKKGDFDEQIKQEINSSKTENGDISKNILEILDSKKRDDLPKLIKKNYPDLWTKLAWSKVNLWRDNQKKQAVVLGDTPDYDRNLFTLDEKSIKMVNYAFEKYWQDDLIYKGSYLVNWSVGLQTAVSDVFGEIEYEKRIDPFVTFEYEAKELKIKNEELKIKFISLIENYLKPYSNWPRVKLSTVRPETKFTDLAVAMHPEKFETYFNLEIFEVSKNGFDKQLALELLEQIKQEKISIFYHLPALKSADIKLVFSDKVDPNFGTGIVKITPGHDLFDFNLYNELADEGKLPANSVQTCIGRDGKLKSEFCGEYAGLTVEQGRLAVIKRLAETGYIPVKTDFENDRKSILAEIKINLESESFVATDYSYQEGIKRLKEVLGEAGNKLEINWDYEHNVTICERSKTVIEPLISEEFFLSYKKEFETSQPSAETKYLIFDWEGVFGDTFDSIVSSYLELNNLAKGERENVVNYILNERMVKPKYTKEKNFSQEEIAEQISFREKEYELKLKYGIKYFQGFIEEVRKIKNVKMAIVSTAHQNFLDEFTGNSGLDFDFLLGFKPGFNKEDGVLEVCKNWGVETSQIYFFTDTIRDVVELETVIPKAKIIGCQWGFHGEKLKEVLPEAQILKNFSEIHGIIKSEKSTNLQKLALEGIEEVTFFSSDYKERGVNFIENIKDWCISRDLIWGHKMPVWYNLDLNPEKKFYSKNELEKLGKDKDLPIQISEFRPKIPGTWVQEEKILDTWFSSCLWPLSTLGFLDSIKPAKIVILHGSPEKERNYKISERNWLPRLKKSLEKKGLVAITPELPKSWLPNYFDWKNTFEFEMAKIGGLDENTILVGHSAGGAFLARYLSENPQKIKQLVLLSASFEKNDSNQRLHELLDFKLNPEIQTYSFPIFVCTSKDEPQYRHKNAEDYAKAFGNNVTYFENYGHFLESDMGKKDFPELLEMLEINTDFHAYYPTQEMISAGDIFYIWIVRMIMIGKYFTGTIPFENVIITPTVRDEQGRKMSKSLGNGLDPVAAIENYSSDSLRLAMLSGMIPNRNFRLGGKIADKLSEKYRNFGNKLWNVARFLENTQELESPVVLNPASLWILEKYKILEQNLELHLEDFELIHSVDLLYKFLWDDFADWYLEYLKTDESQKPFAVALLKQFVISLSPYLPFETEVLWKEFFAEKSQLAFEVKDENWSQRYLDQASVVSSKEFQTVIDFIGNLRSLRGLFAIDPVNLVRIYTTNEILLKYQSFVKLAGRGELVPESRTDLYTSKSNDSQYALDIFEYLKDISLEVERTNKIILDLKKQISALESQLSNEKFLENAEVEIVLEKKQNLEDRKRDLLEQQTKLEFLRS